MRVAYLAWSLPPARNGLGNAAAEILRALREDGHFVVAFALDRAGTTMLDGVEVVGCRPGRLAARLRRLPCVGHLVAPWLFRRALRAVHRRTPFDVAEATNWYAPGFALALLGPVPLVTRNSTPAGITGTGARSPRDRIDHRFAVWMERVSAGRSAALISNTPPHAAMIARFYRVREPGPGHAVIGLSLPEPVRLRGAGAAYPPPPDGPLRVLFVGRAEPRKGFAELLDAAERLAIEAAAGREPEFVLHTVGIGDPGPRAPALLSRLRRHDSPDEAALFALFADAHLVAAPSRYESFGLVYQEAMAFGRPLLCCAEDPSARGFVGDTGAGLLAQRCAAGAIEAALRTLLRDPALRQRLHERSRAAAGRFDRATLGGDTAALYRYAIQCGSNRRSSAASSSARPAPARIAS